MSKLLKKLTAAGWSNHVSPGKPANRDPKNFNWKKLYQGQKKEEEAEMSDPKAAKEQAMDNLFGEPEFYQKSLDEQIDELLKASQGEGSRGGKVIGHTKSGKAIYESSGHAGEKDFDQAERVHAELTRHSHHRKVQKEANKEIKTLNQKLSEKKQKTPDIGTSVKRQNVSGWLAEANTIAAKMLHEGKIDKEKHDLIVAENKANAKRRLGKSLSDTEIDQAIEDLFKSTEGEGSRGGNVTGHTASGKPIYGESRGRKPYPGEEMHNAPKAEGKPKETYIPAGGLTPHYSDEPELKAYKNLISLFKKEGLDFQGQITYNPETKHIETLTPKAEESFKMLQEKYLKAGTKPEGK